jgi:hypothetical protein
MRKAFLFVCAVVMLIACQSHPKKLKKIDSLISLADSTYTTWLTSDTMKHQADYNKVMEDLRFLKLHLREEMVTKSQAINELSDYRALRKPLKKFAVVTSHLNKELAHRSQQLNDLRQDVKNGHFETVDLITEAINDEEARLMKAKNQMEEMFAKIPNLYEVKSKIDPFIDSLRSEIIKQKELE